MDEHRRRPELTGLVEDLVVAEAVVAQAAQFASAPADPGLELDHGTHAGSVQGLQEVQRGWIEELVDDGLRQRPSRLVCRDAPEAVTPAEDDVLGKPGHRAPGPAQAHGASLGEELADVEQPVAPRMWRQAALGLEMRQVAGEGGQIGSCYQTRVGAAVGAVAAQRLRQRPAASEAPPA